MPYLTAAPALSTDLAFVAPGDLVQRVDLEPTHRRHRRCRAFGPRRSQCSRTEHVDGWHVAALLVLFEGETVVSISSARLMDPHAWLEVLHVWGRRPAEGETVHSSWDQYPEGIGRWRW